MTDHLTYDVAIVGGGIVGLATAWQTALRRPDLKIALLEKEADFAQHQTGRNSGVLHSGIYYKPGSYKAKQCRQGKRLMEEFCKSHGVAYEICGKVIVAVDTKELPSLNFIYQRGQANGVGCQMIDRQRLSELEPHVAGIQAIHVHDTGIVDYVGVCNKLVELLRQRGHAIQANAAVTMIVSEPNACVIESNWQTIHARLLVNCAGLHSDRVTTLAGDKTPARIVPFRGEYFKLKASAKHLCKNLIYPVPDPSFPFLGVHFTRMIDGSIECGPNAVFAFAREGYQLSTINWKDLRESLSYGGFLKMAMKHWKMGMGELWRSASKGAFVKALRRLMPEITSADLETAPAGVRAQAVLPNGELVDDFLIVDSARCVHVTNAPSPAATASLDIGNAIADRVAARLT